MANPFYIPVQNQVTPALQNLTQTLTGIGRMREEQRRYDTEQAAKQAKQEELESAITEFQTAVKDKDYDTIAKMSIRYPEMGKSALDQLGSTTERTRQNAVDTLFDLYQNPDNASEILQKRTDLVLSEGGDPVDTQALAEMFEKDPEGAMDFVEGGLARVAPERYKNYKELTAKDKDKFVIKDTPTGFARINEQTGEVQEIKIGSKAEEVATKKAKKELEASVKGAGTKFDQSKKLRDEYDKKSKDFYQVEDAFGRIQASVGEPDEEGNYESTAAGDLSLVFNYMKMLDPGSVVRESEFATAENARGVPDGVRNSYNKFLEGERMTPTQRKQFVSQAEKLMDKATSTNKKRKDQIIRVGKQYGISQEDIFGLSESTDMSDDDLINKYL